MKEVLSEDGEYTARTRDCRQQRRRRRRLDDRPEGLTTITEVLAEEDDPKDLTEMKDASAEDKRRVVGIRDNNYDSGGLAMGLMDRQQHQRRWWRKMRPRAQQKQLRRRQRKRKRRLVRWIRGDDDRPTAEASEKEDGPK